MSSNDQKDLDFDELDKAVTSLMGGVKDKDPEAKENNLDINTTLGPDESPSYQHLDQVAGTIGSEAIDRPEQTVSLGEDVTSPSATSPALKRSGRFMDVVHPSSDMRPSPTQVSREGTTIDVPEALPPLDTTAGNLPSSSDAPVEEADTDDVPTVEEVKQPEVDKAPDEPLSSPFLPDTKVEKRPLGGLATDRALVEEKAEAKKEPETEPTVDVPSEEPMIDQDSDTPAKKDEDEFSKMDAMAAEPAKNLNEVNEHIPEEYKNELLAVEQNLAAPLDADEGSAVSESTPETPAAPVIASIPQQYQEKPSSGEQTSGAIYDTDNYHKPVSHPAEQKSGWMWVIVIIVLIVIGGLLGAAAYYGGLI